MEKNSDEKMIILLRRCGHFLHHNVDRNRDIAPLVEALSAEERTTLEALLEKCLEHWNRLPKEEPNREN